jgi:hypothetical protein
MAYICLACSNFLSIVVRISEGAIMFVVVWGLWWWLLQENYGWLLLK